MKAAKSQITKQFLEFGPFAIDVVERLLLRDGKPVSLTSKAFDTLLALAENAGHVLEKDELMKTVWPDTIVEENNLTQAISTLRKALAEDPARPTYIETIPRRGYRFVAPVRERQEEVVSLLAREESVSAAPTEVEEAQEGEQVAATASPDDHVAVDVITKSEPLAVTAVPRLTIGALLAVGLLGIILLTVWYLRVGRGAIPKTGLDGSAPIRLRRSVAVLGLKNLSQHPDAAWLSTALSEMLTTELAAGDELRTIPGEDIARMKMELSLADADSLGKDTLTRVRKNLGADYVVLGSYTDLGGTSGGKLRLDLRVQDATAGETIAAVGEIGTESDLFELVSRTGTQLRAKLGVSEIAAGDANVVRASLPTSRQATQFYAEGLEKLRVLDYSASRDLLEKAVSAEPRYPLAHTALAVAWSALGYDTKAQEEAKKAVELSAGLAREQQLLIEGRYYEITTDWSRAAETYKTLASLFPDSLQYGLRLATAQTMAGKGQDAEATLNSVRRLPPPARDDATIDLEEAALADSTSNFKHEQEVASAAARKGIAQGARLLVARARVMEGRALWKIGRPQEAQAALAEAKDIFVAAGDREGRAEALHANAEVLVDLGDLDGAKKGYEEALSIHRQSGNEAGVAANLNDIAQILWLQSDLDTAGKMYNQALPAFREVGDRHGVADVQNNLGNILYAQGNLKGAREMYNEALSTFRGIGDQSGAAEALVNIGLILYAQGDLAGAKKSDEESLAISRSLETRSDSAYALFGLGEVATAQGDLAAARAWHQQALAIRNEIGQSALAGESKIDLATISLEDGRAAEAEASAREAAVELEKQKATDDEALAEAVLARALSAQGKTGEARQASQRASSLAETSGNRGVRLAVAIAEAQVTTASGNSADRVKALKSLQATFAEATKLGFFNYQLEARLALGEVSIQAGDVVGGTTNLRDLRKEASDRGFGLISRKAAEATGREK